MMCFGLKDRKRLKTNHCVIVLLDDTQLVHELHVSINFCFVLFCFVLSCALEASKSASFKILAGTFWFLSLRAKISLRLSKEIKANGLGGA